MCISCFACIEESLQILGRSNIYKTLHLPDRQRWIMVSFTLQRCRSCMTSDVTVHTDAALPQKKMSCEVHLYLFTYATVSHWALQALNRNGSQLGPSCLRRQGNHSKKTGKNLLRGNSKRTPLLPQMASRALGTTGRKNGKQKNVSQM